MKEELSSLIESNDNMVKSLEIDINHNFNIAQNTEDEIFDYKEKTLKILFESLQIILLYMSYLLAGILVIYFSKPGGNIVYLSVIKASGMFTTFIFISSSIALGFGMLVARNYSRKEYRNLSLITSKGLLLGYSLGIFLFLFLNIFCELIIRQLLSEEETILSTIFTLRIMSVSLLVLIPYTFYFRYLSGTENFTIIYSFLIADITLILSLLISSYALNSYLIGMSISFDLFNTVIFVGSVLIYYYFNPLEKIENISFSEITDNFFEFLVYSGGISLTVILSTLSNEIVPFVASIIDDDAVALYFVVVSMTYFFSMFGDAFSIIGMIELNHNIGVKNFKNLRKIFKITFILITGLALIFVLCLVFFYSEIVSIYTNDQKLLQKMVSIKYQVIFSIFLNMYQGFFVETLCSLDDNKTPFMLTLFSRYFLFIGLSYLLRYKFDIGFSSIANSLLVSIIIENLTNGYAIFYKIINLENLKLENDKSK